MSGQIAHALEDAAKKAEQGLAKDFATGYHDILKETEQKTGQVADHVAENEARTAEDIGRSGRRPSGESPVAEPHPAEGGPEGAGDRGGTSPGDEPPDLSAGEPGGGQGTEGNGGCRTGGDPVDVVSGQMLTHETDVELPGLLPLLLRRAYASGYHGGTLFGPGWSSTLTQRVQLDRQGIHYAGDDAQILHYPVPTQPGQQVYPLDGARWPLTWDRATDTICIEDTATGWIRRFDANVCEGIAAARPITALSNRNGQRIDYRYGPSGLPIEIQHSGGYRVAVDIVHAAGLPRIEALRLLDGTEDGHGTTLRRFAYDARARLTDVVNSSGLPLVYAYDSEDRIVSWTDRNGHWYAYEYDADGRVERGHGAGGLLEATFAYDVERRVTSVTNSLGQRSEFHYDEHRHVSAVVDPLGHTVFTEHDRHGRLLTLTDELGRTTRHTYDDRGDLVRIDHPDGTHTSAEYDELRLPVRLTAPDGQVRRQVYDASGNPVETVDPAGATTRFCYDEQGRLTSVVDPEGQSTVVHCSPVGLPIQVSDPLGATTHWSRDAFGRAIAVTDALGNVQRFAWTLEGLLAARTAPDGAAEHWTYDAEGNPLRHVDRLGATTEMRYGAFGLLLARTTADGGTYTFTHDTELRLLSVVNPQGLTWGYSYDAAGRTSAETDFNGVATHYTHDAAGQLISRSVGPDGTIAYSYDVSGNLVGKTANGESTSFGYDAAGRLLSAVSATCALTRTYDRLGRTAAETVNGRTVTVDHDRLGRRTYRRTPSGVETIWAYDPVGNPVSLSTSGYSIAFEHDSLGLETYRRFGSGLVLSSEWDQQQQLSARTLTGSAEPGPLQRRSYTYSADGFPASVSDQHAGTRHFDTDPLGRVTAVRADDWVEVYSYDRAGNPADAHWPTRRDSAGLGTRHYEGTLLRSAGRITFEHDDRGRTVTRWVHTLSGRTDTWRYTWDAEDRLVRATTPDGTCWLYQYDPLGRRISKQRLAPDRESVVEWTEFSWDGSLLVEQTAHGPALPGPYSLTWDYRGLHPVAQTERISLPSGEVDQRFFAVITDLIGAPTHLLEADGSVAWEGVSNLWGATSRSSPGGTGTPLRFPGQYYDPETRLHYNVYRHYDPVTGRYLVGDPLGLAPGPNPHAYVDNPMVWADPLGLSAFTPLNLGTGKIWSPVDYRGQRIYQRDDLMNPGYVSPRDKYGRSNLKRMTQGLAPMGPDDKPVNLHHMLQTQDGPIAEVTQSMHLSQGDYTGSGSYNTLHWKAGSKIPSGIDRDAFADWKSDYWKDRAKGLSGGGCGT